MKIDVQGMTRRNRFVIDYAAGIALCVLAGVTFAVAVSGWIFIISDLSELRTRLDAIQTERTSQISEVGTAMHVLRMRLETVSHRLEQVQAPTRGHLDAPDPRACAIENLGAILNGHPAQGEGCARSGEEEAR